MRMTYVWLLALLVAAGCSGGDSAPPAGTATGARPGGAAPEAGGPESGAAYGSRPSVVGDEAAGRGAADRARSPAHENDAGGGIPFARPREQGADVGRAGTPVGPDGVDRSAPPKRGEDEQTAAVPEKASPGGAAIRSLGESFLRALGRAALGGGQPQTREPPPAEDDPFPQGEPPEGQPSDPSESQPEEESEAP